MEFVVGTVAEYTKIDFKGHTLMFYLKFNGESIGSSNLENGDPEKFSVSGDFANVGGPETLAKWLKHLGGTEEKGITHFVLDERFLLATEDDQEIGYAEATLIAVQETNEAFIDVTGIPEEDYKACFAKHIRALQNIPPELSLKDRINALKSKKIV
jgi:hypothetical protein